MKMSVILLKLALNGTSVENIHDDLDFVYLLHSSTRQSSQHFKREEMHHETKCKFEITLPSALYSHEMFLSAFFCELQTSCCILYGLQQSRRQKYQLWIVLHSAQIA